MAYLPERLSSQEKLGASSVCHERAELSPSAGCGWLADHLGHNTHEQNTSRRASGHDLLVCDTVDNGPRIQKETDGP